LSKFVIACKNFDLTLQEWFDQKGALAIPKGDSDEGKDIVRYIVHLFVNIYDLEVIEVI
jgi:hypothetical protein